MRFPPQNIRQALSQPNSPNPAAPEYDVQSALFLIAGAG